MTHFMKVAQKLVIALLVGIALAATGFQETTLAIDSSPTSPSLHARVTRAQAERAALTKVPGGKVKSAKLAQENGQLIWSIDIVTPLTKKIAAVQVDARSGKVLSKLTQSPGDRAEESVGAQKKK
jgi:Peptidase propeptide and YPEB domain